MRDQLLAIYDQARHDSDRAKHHYDRYQNRFGPWHRLTCDRRRAWYDASHAAHQAFVAYMEASLAETRRRLDWLADR